MQQGIAPLVDGWRRRNPGSLGAFPLGAPIGPEGGALTPFPQAPLDVLVEIRVDGSWLNITPDVFGGDRAEITITRGQQNEGSRTDPASCRLTLNNRNGVYSPRNPESALFGKIGRNTELRVKVGPDTRFHGEVPAWPQDWDKTDTDVWVDLEAAGILRRLGQGAKPQNSALYRAINSLNQVHRVLVHWPFEDESGAFYVASATPGWGPMVVASGLRPAADDFLPGSKPLALVPANEFTHFHGVIPNDPTGGATGYRFDWYIHMETPPTSPAVSQIGVFGATGTAARWEISINNTTLFINAYNALGVPVVVATTGIHPTWFEPGGTLFRLEVVPDGGNVDWILWQVPVDTGVGFAGSGTFAGSTGTLTFFAIAWLSPVEFGIGHAVASTDTVLGWLAQADIGYRTETADERFWRLCIENSVLGRRIGTAGDSEPMGPQKADTFLNLIRECETVDGGILGETVDALGLFYRTRRSLYTQDPTLALDYAARHIASTPRPIEDDDQTVNDVTLRREGGSTARVEETTGPLSTAPPPDGVGVYDTADTVNVHRDDQLPQLAAWWVHLGTVDEPRFPVIHINMAKSVVANDPDLVGAAQQVKQGDRVTIANPPTWLPRGAISQLAVGLTERLGNFARDLRFNCRPASPYQVGVVDSADNRIDTAGSTMAAEATDTATSLSVASSNGLWTTDTGQMPFDVEVLGEQITVTAISGASSPQTFTVVRSVNGVQKPLAAGAAVKVFSPFMAGL